MIFRGKIHKNKDQLKKDKILGLVNSKNYMEAIDLLTESMALDNSLSSKAEEALQMIAGFALKETAVAPSTSEDYEKFKYNGSCIVKICSVIHLPPPIEALGWYIKGAGSGGLGDYDEAIRCFDKTIEIESNDATACEAWKDKVTVLFHLKKYKEALKCTEEAWRALDNAEVDVEKLKQGIMKIKKQCEEKLSSSKS